MAKITKTIEVEIRVDDRPMIGTCAWLQDLLQTKDAHFQIRPYGIFATPSIWLTGDGGLNRVIAFVTRDLSKDGSDYLIDLSLPKANIAYLATHGRHTSRKTFCAYLTPAAEKMVDEIIKTAIGLLKDHLTNDKADFKMVLPKIKQA